MRKGLFLAVAALFVLTLPLSASAGTDVYRVADRDLNGLYEAQSHQWMCFLYDPGTPNLASAFADRLSPWESVCLRYVNATFSQTVRVKTNKDGTKDLGWNLVGHGTVQIWKHGYGGPSVSSTWIEGSLNLFAAGAPPVENLLYEGPVQVEQVVQDEGNDGGCAGLSYDYSGNRLTEVPAEGTALDLFACDWPYLDYVMHHWKLTGNRIAFNKLTIKNGTFTWRDEIQGFEVSAPWPLGY